MISEAEVKKIYDNAIREAAEYRRYGEVSVYKAYISKAIAIGEIIGIDFLTVESAVNSAKDLNALCNVDYTKIDQHKTYYVCGLAGYTYIPNPDYPEFSYEPYKGKDYDVYIHDCFTDDEWQAISYCNNHNEDDYDYGVGTMASYIDLTGEELIDFLQKGEFVCDLSTGIL